jgi:hypothetical protein
MNEKYPYGIGPAGRWLIFAGLPLAICAVLYTSLATNGGGIRGVSERFLPYVIFFVPAAICYGFNSHRNFSPIGIITV